jgi:hypothetical protein
MHACRLKTEKSREGFQLGWGLLEIGLDGAFGKEGRKLVGGEPYR